jgi:alkanesulfonate monooxygenase SsuD/methylene tetrahydromethanopterin reductase-like flavin-dependent oxidoreductase (luciferase family)
MSLQLGLFVDGRNPTQWGRPWPEHYARLVEIAAEADELGADCIWLTEHHGFDDGYLTQPLVLAAAIAARTRRCRIGTAVTLAPIRHPRHLAEEAAVVDLLSGGRLELGIGAGYVPSEFEMFGVDISSRFADLDAMFLHLRELFDQPGMMPPPQQPHLPVWLGYQQPIGARKAGRVGAALLSIRRAVAAAYLEGLAEGGHDPSIARLAGDVDIIVADDPESAYRRIAPHYLHQINSYAGAAGRPLLALEDLGDRRGEGRARVAVHLQVLTVDEAVADVTARVDGLPVEHVYTWSTVAEMPDDLATRHRELWLGPVRNALTSD